MSNVRRPVSLLTSLSFGLGAALLLLLAASGATPAAAAPAHIGPNGPNPLLPFNCHARNDSNTLLVYDSADSAAVRLAVAAALSNDTVRLAGTCAGVAAGGGTTQTVLINKVLTLVGGYTPTDWVDTFPISQPTTLDAQGQGRVITASGDITIANLTVQNGNSAGGDGGGIWDGHDLTALGVINLLSNTALVSTTVDGLAAPVETGGSGGAARAVHEAFLGYDFVKFNSSTSGQAIVQANSAANGGGIDAQKIDTLHITVKFNRAINYAGGLYTTVSINIQHAVFGDNSAIFGGDLYNQGNSTIDHMTSYGSHATAGGGVQVVLGPGYANWSNNTVGNAYAPYGAAGYFYSAHVTVNFSQISNDVATQGGGGFYVVNSPMNINNTLFVGDISPEGNAVDILDNLGTQSLMQSNFNHYLATVNITHFADADAAGVRPSASAVVSPGAAIFVNGASLLLTDTIVGGYATDLAMGANPSTTVHEDFNLFENTPVFSGNVTSGGHSLVGNPLFADNLGHLSAGSPAIDHGIDVGINVDFDGNHRPSGAGFDIGAYEFQVALAKLFLPFVRR